MYPNLQCWELEYFSLNLMNGISLHIVIYIRQDNTPGVQCLVLDSPNRELMRKSGEGAGSSWEVEGTPRERTHRTHRRWPVSRADISTSNDSERMMMENRLLKNLLRPSTSVPRDYALSLKFPPSFHILLKCCCCCFFLNSIPDNP